MKTVSFLAAAATAATIGGAAGAAPIYPDNIVSFVQGNCNVVGITGPANVNGCSIARSNPAAALGSPDDDFVSLGFGGELVLGFSGGPYSGDRVGKITEVTFNRKVGHHEAAEVYSVLGGVSTLLGTINNDRKVSSLMISGTFDAIMLVDVTKTAFDKTTSFDGFDVESVGIAPIPLPAAGLLLLGGVGALGALRRRKAA